MTPKIPEPSSEAHAHSEQLRQLICDDIDANGPMTLARYMEIALYEPALGYYRNGSQKFGASGDFITAPELSSLFSRCLARRCADVFDTMGTNVLEIGAGSGRLACDMMRELERLGALPQRYFILELSGELAARQREFIQKELPSQLERFEWLTAWPDNFSGVIVANELFDAMPVHRFYVGDTLQEYYVTHQDGKLTWVLGEMSDACIIEQLTRYEIPFEQGYDSEVNVIIPSWMASLSQSVNNAHMIFIDYGYKREVLYHHERSMGTLMCHFQHHAHDDPLRYPGIQDITTHVDFTLLAETAVANGFEVFDFMTQAQFLMKHDVMSLATTPNDMQHLKQLLLPGQMGEAFKVLELKREN